MYLYYCFIWCYSLYMLNTNPTWKKNILNLTANEQIMWRTYGQNVYTPRISWRTGLLYSQCTILLIVRSRYICVTALGGQIICVEWFFNLWRHLSYFLWLQVIELSLQQCDPASVLRPISYQLTSLQAFDRSEPQSYWFNKIGVFPIEISRNERYKIKLDLREFSLMMLVLIAFI